MNDVVSNENQVDIPLQLCGFRVGDDYYAISVLDVQEVIKPQTVTPVPMAETHIRGLINLRGQIVTAISLRKLFGLEEDLSAQHMNVIVRANESLTALVVDEILDVINVERSAYEKAPETLPESMKKFVSGVYKMDKRILILLNLKELVANQ